MIGLDLPRFVRDQRTARGAVGEAVRAILAKDDQAANRALEPLEDPLVMFLACSYMTGQICRALPKPMGLHSCPDPICPVATRVIDRYLAGDRVAALHTITRLIATEPARSVDLAWYLLMGVVTAVEAGRLTVPQDPERN